MNINNEYTWATVTDSEPCYSMSPATDHADPNLAVCQHSSEQQSMTSWTGIALLIGDLLPFFHPVRTSINNVG